MQNSFAEMNTRMFYGCNEPAYGRHLQYTLSDAVPNDDEASDVDVFWKMHPNMVLLAFLMADVT